MKKTQYYGSSLHDQGVSKFRSKGRVRCTMSISKGDGGTRLGEKIYTYNSASWTDRTTNTLWVDHSYKCNVVHCRLEYN